MPTLTGLTFALSVNGQVTASSGQLRKVCNVFVYENTNGVSPGFVNAFIAIFDSRVWATIRSRLHTDYVGVSYSFRTPADMSAAEIVSGAVPGNGTRTGVRIPLDVCVNQNLFTAARGRSFRGLKRFSPLSQLDVLKDELTSALNTAWNAVDGRVSGTLTSSFGEIWRPVVLSRQLSGVVGGSFVAVGAPVISVVHNKTLGLVRHRRERTNR